MNKNTKKNKITTKTKTKSKKQNSNLKLTNNINIKDIFSNNNKISKNVIFLKKLSFDIFYNYNYKLPLLVRESLTNLTGKGDNKIERSKIQDAFIKDPDIPTKHSYNNKDYETYEYYSGSHGHIAPASWHKLNRRDYDNTFLFSNIIPQNYIMNAGIWNYLERWCYNLKYNKKIFNINIFTGIVLNDKSTICFNAKLEKSALNIPSELYKIISFNYINVPDVTFIDIIVMKNKAINIINNNNINNINLNKYILKKNLYNSFETKTGLNIKKLLQFYNINNENLKSFKQIINLYCIPNKLRNKEQNKQFIDWYYFLSTSTIDELYKLFNENSSLKFYYDNILMDEKYKTSYISTYFYKKRNILIRENILYTNYNSLKEFDLFFNKYKDDLYNKYIINENVEKHILYISQDDYLIKYYNIVKNKLTKNN